LYTYPMNDNPPFFGIVISVLFLTACSAGIAAAQLTGDAEFPQSRAVPLPCSRVAFEHEGQEWTRYHFGPSLKRPFWYPLVSRSGYRVTRMGNPQSPQGERHHYSVWLSHQNVAGTSFWEDGGPSKIVHVALDRFVDETGLAAVTTDNEWRDGAGRVLLRERRMTTVRPLDKQSWLMQIDVEFAPAKGENSVVLGKTAYGLLGVRVAKTMDLVHGRGRILDSEGRRNEAEIFRKPARWVDFSGRVAKDAIAGVALFDYPDNCTFPTPFHVRDVGFMMPSITLNEAIEVTKDKPLKVRYGLWVHDRLPAKEEIEAAWKRFTQPTED